MDRERELGHLKHAERVLALGAQHIAEQEQRIADLDRDGHDTKRPLAMLALYRRLRGQHLAHRRSILERLLQDTKAAKRTVGPIFPPGHYDHH